MHRTHFPTMGTIASLTVAAHVDPALAETAAHVLRTSLAADERRFSHYRADSDITRWLAGEDVGLEAAVELEDVFDACIALQAESAGAFTVADPRTGAIDTAGYVKGYAIGKAVEAIRACGVVDFTVNVGGDSFSSGSPSSTRPWRVAIADPTRPRAIAAVVDAADMAVATSGTAERGHHIWLHTGVTRSDLRSFTVIGPDIALADAYATIGFAMGVEGMAWVARHPGYSSLVVDIDGRVMSDAALVSAA